MKNKRFDFGSLKKLCLADIEENLFLKASLDGIVWLEMRVLCL